MERITQMPIYFRNTLVNAPFMFDSIGNQWPEEATLRPEGYPHYHYLQTELGCGQVEIQGKTYELQENEGFLIAPSIPHSYRKISDTWQTAFATFTGTLEASLPSMLQNRPVIWIEKDQGLQIASLISKCVNEISLHGQQDIKYLSASCYSLLLNFTDQVNGHAPMQDPLYQRYIVPVVQEIETHFSTDLTAQALSEKAFVSPQYLSRLFRRFFSCSVYEYLTMYRINKAKELLLVHAYLKVQDIASMTGFSDTSHFISMFKKATGMTPLEFRRMH